MASRSGAAARMWDRRRVRNKSTTSSIDEVVVTGWCADAVVLIWLTAREKGLV